MITRTADLHTDMRRHGQARRRVRRTAGQRLFCSTNGCPTILEPDVDGRGATCPICGFQRQLAGAGPRRATH